MIDSANDARYEREIASSLSLATKPPAFLSLSLSLSDFPLDCRLPFLHQAAERERRKGMERGREEGRVATSFRSCAAEARLPATGQTDEREREREGHEVLVNRLKGRIESCPPLDGKRERTSLLTLSC